MWRFEEYFHRKGYLLKYKLVIFDFDGTLADTFPWFVKNIRAVADKYGFKHIKDEEVEELRNFDAKHMLKFVEFPILKLPLIATYMRGLMKTEIDEIKLFDGVPEMLHQLYDAGLTLAVVSTNSRENVKAVLGADLSALITDYECGVSLFSKEAKLKKISHKCKISLSEAIYIADELRDFDSARNVKLDIGAVAWGYTNPEALKKLQPTLFFENVREIEKKLKMLAK